MQPGAFHAGFAPVVGALLSLVLFRYLRHPPVSIQVVSTIGLFVAIPVVAVLLWSFCASPGSG